MTIPNVLTGLRLALVPVFLALIILDTESSHLAAVVVFVAAALTDWLDGFIARRAHQQSEFGRVADPLADRLLIFVGLLGLVILRRLDLWVMLILVSRDAFMLYGYRYLQSRGARVTVTWPGKVTTAVLLTAFGCLLLDIRWTLPATDLTVCSLLLYTGVGLSLASAAHYVVLARRALVESGTEPAA